MPKVHSDFDFQSAAKPINLPAPTAAGDAASKAYVDSAVENLNWKDAARVGSVANINLASPGANVDGVAMVAGDRFLAKDQTAPAENGIYVWNGAATPATRSADMNSAAEVEMAIVVVEEGTNAGAKFRQTAINVTLGTTALSWTPDGSSAPAASETTAGVAEIATQGEADAGTDDARFITPLKLATHSGRKRKHTATVGDGSATQIDVTHNFNTKDVIVELFRNSGNFDTVIADVSRPTVNSVRLNFAVAPTAAQFSIVIIA